MLTANVCIFFSGTLVQSWTAFWSFWDKLPWWSFAGAGAAMLAGRPAPSEVDDEMLDALEEGRAGTSTTFGIGKSTYVAWMDRLFGSGQIAAVLFGRVGRYLLVRL